MQTPNYELQARRIVVASIANGACTDGHPADRVGDLFRELATVFAELDMEYGTEATTVGTDFAIAAINAGLIYAGSETALFVREVSGHVREAVRELASTSY